MVKCVPSFNLHDNVLVKGNKKRKKRQKLSVITEEHKSDIMSPSMTFHSMKYFHLNNVGIHIKFYHNRILNEYTRKFS